MKNYLSSLMLFFVCLVGVAAPADVSSTAPASAVPAPTPPWQFQVHNESSVGIADITGGNSSESYNAAENTSVQWDKNLTRLTARYLRASTNGTESAKNWDGFLRYEREISGAFSGYTDFGLESDIYSGFVQRNDHDVGGKYVFAKSPDTNLTGELGYRYSFTQYVAPTSNDVSNYVRFYVEFSQNIVEGIQGKIWLEYLPSITDSNDYLANAEPSLTFVMSKIISLKTSYLFKYHNISPPGLNTRLETVFLTSVVAKF